MRASERGRACWLEREREGEGREIEREREADRDGASEHERKESVRCNPWIRGKRLLLLEAVFCSAIVRRERRNAARTSRWRRRGGNRPRFSPRVSSAGVFLHDRRASSRRIDGDEVEETEEEEEEDIVIAALRPVAVSCRCLRVVSAFLRACMRLRGVFLEAAVSRSILAAVERSAGVRSDGGFGARE